MSRSDEVQRLTENVYKSIMEQFNPCLRNFIAMGRSYEKTLTREVLLQMAEVHRQIHIQLEEMLKSFHNELLTELEKKVELDARYLNAALRKYQTDHKSKGESLDRAELKKLRRKSSKNPSKYGGQEMMLLEAASNQQGALQSCLTDAYQSAQSEERRRYAFLVERQLAPANSSYQAKAKELLGQQFPVWYQQQRAGGAAGPPAPPLPATAIVTGAKPLPPPPDTRQQRVAHLALMNGEEDEDEEDFQRWREGLNKQQQRPTQEVYCNTLPARRQAPPPKNNSTAARTLPRSRSVAAGLGWNAAGRRQRVQALFSHAAEDNGTLLSFRRGDVITLLVPEARDGWHYGEHEHNHMRGWFPFSYTRLLPDTDGAMASLPVHSQGRSISTGNLLERDDFGVSTPDYTVQSRLSTSRKQLQPLPSNAQRVEELEPRFSSSDIKLISTV